MRLSAGSGAILLCIMLFAPACGGKGEAQDKSTAAIPDRATGSAQATGRVEPPAREAIPEPREVGTPEAGVMIVPRFDPENDVETLAVKPGDHFELYVGGIHPAHEVASAAYRLDLPTGIEVLGEGKLFATSLSLGTYQQYFAITYPCQSGDRFYPFIRYTCLVKPSFAGGEIRVDAGIPMQAGAVEQFLGFVSCGDFPEKVPASGGAATLTVE